MPRRFVSGVNNFYPRSPCGERPLAPKQNPTQQNFYPRSPCGERLAGPSGPAFLYNFYPRSPCGERRSTIRFLPNICPYFYPRSPCGERPGAVLELQCILGDFYPRSPCGERPMMLSMVAIPILFLSTLSLRRATRYPAILGSAAVISIHALLAESDSKKMELNRTASNFYPRSPCGERL